MSKRKYEPPRVYDLDPSALSGVRGVSLEEMRQQAARESAIRRALAAGCPDLSFGIISALARCAVRLEREQRGGLNNG